jgi:hypothetical protein
MNLDFPTNPIIDDEYSFSGKTWIFTGKGWRLKTDGLILERKAVNANSEIFISDGNTNSFMLATTDFIGKVNNSIVTLDGLTQIPGLHYSVIANTVNFETSPAANSLIEIRLFELVDANSVFTITEKTTEFVPGNSFFTMVYDEANTATNTAAEAVSLIAFSLETANNTLNTANIVLNTALEQANSVLETSLFVLDTANLTLNTAISIGDQSNSVLETANSVLASANVVLNTALLVLEQNADYTGIITTAGTFGSNTQIPILTVEANGRISAANTISFFVPSSGFANVNLVVFTSGTTYTPTTGMIGCLVIVTGAGAGGGGADAFDTAAGSGGGGGGAGGTALRTYTAAQIGSTASFAIGSASGGGSGTGGTQALGAGGTTTFTPSGSGTAMSASGGLAGLGGGEPSVGSKADGGQGGNTFAGGLLDITGGSGHSGIGDDIGEMSIGGNGGASFWGGGGRGGVAQGVGNQTGSAGAAFGSGGGGAACIDTTTGANGAPGRNGVLVILEFLP